MRTAPKVITPNGAGSATTASKALTVAKASKANVAGGIRAAHASVPSSISCRPLPLGTMG
jgi:hypothetical protein